MVRHICLVAALAVLASSGAFAAPITLNPGESAFFNFDLTGVIPGPTYAEISIQTNLSNYEGDELGHWNFYRAPANSGLCPDSLPWPNLCRPIR